MIGPCAKCGKPNADKKCSKCYAVVYCSKECQRDHWKVHKKECSKLAKERQKQDDEENANGAATTTQPAAPAAAAPTRPDPPRPAPAALATPPAAAAPVTTAAAPQLPALPSRPYTAPDKLSARGKETYAKIKPILDGPPEAVPNTITETEFCIEVDGDRRRVDTRVVYAMSDYMREAVTLAPVATGEALKRMLALRQFLKHPDAFLFANWCSILGAVMTSDGASARLAAVKAALDALPPGAPPPLDFELPADVDARVNMARADANAFLTLGLQCLQEAETQGPTNGKPAPPPAALHGMRARVATVLAYVMRHFPGFKERREQLLRSVTDAPSERQADPYTRGLAWYALAHDACVAGDTAAFERGLGGAQAAFRDTGSPALSGFIDQHRARGCNAQCATEMGGVMDGSEAQFGTQAMQGFLPPPKEGGGGAAAASNGASGSGGKSGAKLVPGGKGAERGGASKGGAGGRRGDAAVKEVEAEVKAGYALYQRGEMEEGVEHFARVLKQAFDLERTGMAVSVIFSASHAHIEGCAQLRRWGKAENTVLKLKELAEYADAQPIPFSIDTVADRLHLWWREKRAGLLARQRQYTKAYETLEDAVERAARLGPHYEAAVHALRASYLADLAQTGSAADTHALQAAVDRGLECIAADPPPAGGSGSAAAAWASECKLEQWARLLPLLRALEAEGVRAGGAEAALLPLCERFDIELGEAAENAEDFVMGGLGRARGAWGGLGELNAMSVLFGLAVALPVVLGLWLVVRALLLPAAAVEDEAAAAGDSEL